MNIAFLDFETTGLTLASVADIALQPRAIEICIVVCDSETRAELKRFSTLINPNVEISPEITRITGITNYDLVGQPDFFSVVDSLSKFMVGVDVLVAHNLNFDLSVLVYELKRVGRDTSFPFPPTHICTAQTSELVTGERLSLKKLHEKLTGTKVKQIHRADADVQILIEAYWGLHENYSVRPV